ncbi:hypothetical protein G6O69_17370 [Pseudenhygromyxa sp. WMMC2535]|uniref:hypothetical protein n=1 Tax=Pseudenhygromyxa sp. WMMC2535 TaxID=2712867 RepID=UPI00155629A2|nr:hypothetical protein [Pseudenhygromyxa sp. WMMC2535]NVB39616.1 hypothetical protein [Pseudenhygromyxa sp. WMMC2535]
MPSRRVIASPLALSAVLLLTPSIGCKTKNTNVSVADPNAQQDDARARPGQEGEGQPVQRPPVEMLQTSGSLSGLGDILDGASQLMNIWSPPDPGMPAINLTDLVSVSLIQAGFAPGFFESLDLGGVHAFEFAFPHEGQPHATDADIDAALSIAAIDPTRMIESLPSEAQPQPVGQGLWQLVEDDVEVFFRTQSASIELATSMESLGRASSLPAKAPAQPRFNLRVSNLPTGDIDISDLIPLYGAPGQALSSVINELEAVELHADFGTDRALTAVAIADAPFERLGLDPIGPAAQAESALAKTLPPDAMGVWLMPWGDPALLHKMLDNLPVDQVPAPFDAYASQLLAGVHKSLDAITKEILVAPYLDDKGQMTVVFAAEVEDEAQAQAALREVFGAAQKTIEGHIALVGSNPDYKYSVAFKQGGSKAGKFKGDLFTVTVPKSMHDDVDEISWFIGQKPKLEVSVIVAEGKLFVAMGAGQKRFLSTLGRRLTKASDAGLESGGGLALARALTGGCQLCAALDPAELAELALTVVATSPDSSEPERKAAKSSLAKLRKLDLEGEAAMSLRFDAKRGSVGVGVPEQLLFIDPAKATTIRELFEAIDAADTQVASAK